MVDVNKEVEFNKMTKMHERVWENFKRAFDTEFTVTKEEIIDVLKAYPYNLGFMSYFMANFSTDSSEDACEIVCQIIENLKGLIELLLPLASVPMFAGDNSFIELKNYLFECEQIYELLQLNMLESMLGDITNIVKESIEDE